MLEPFLDPLGSEIREGLEHPPLPPNTVHARHSGEFGMQILRGTQEIIMEMTNFILVKEESVLVVV